MTEEWHQLNPLTILHEALTILWIVVIAGVTTAIGLASGIGVLAAMALVVAGGILVVGLTVTVEVIRHRRTRYRVLPDIVELREGVFVRRRRTMQRARIRVVDLTAGPIARLLGLTKVTVGTGEQASSGSLDLKFVTRGTGEALRGELLAHAAMAEQSEEPSDGRLATFDPGWVKYAPMSFLAPLIGLSAFGLALEVSTWFGLESELIDWVLDWFGDAPLVLSLVVLVALSLIVGAIAAIVVFIEGWTNYRLDREPGGTMRLQRGLLTTRSLSIDEERLRGVEIVEPLGVRVAGAARVDAVVTGLSGQGEEDNKKQQNVLLPPAPADLAHSVAATVLREPTLPSDSVALIPHPIAARGRRLRWALMAVAGVLLVLVVLGLLTTTVLLHIAWISALVLVPAAVLWAFDAYRSLGHGLTGDYLITREGSIRRGTVMLQRRGMVGWTARQSIFQKRAGLMTLQATTAAGSGGYRIADAGEDEALAFAEQAMPQLIGPFLEKS